MNPPPYLTQATMAPQSHLFSPTSPTAPQLASSPPQQQQAHQAMIQQQLLQQQQQQQQQQRLGQLHQDPRQQLASMGTNVVLNNPAQQQQLLQQQQQQQHQALGPQTSKQSWDMMTGANVMGDPMTLQIGPNGSLVTPQWGDVYGLGNLPPVHLARAKNINVVVSAQQQQQQHLMTQRAFLQSQQQPPQQQGLSSYQNTVQPRSQEDVMAVNGQYLFSTPSSMPTISAPEMGMMSPQHQNHQHATSPGHLQASCSPEMSIKTSPIEPQLSWTWEEAIPQQDDMYSTPAHARMGFEGTQEDVETAGSVKLLKVFTSSKKDDDGEFRKGQQFYLNIQLSPEDRERYRYLRIPTENIVLPCRADSAGRINLNTSGKRSAQTMMVPTSAQEEDVLSLKLTTYLEPEHRVVVPCGRCKDKTPEILRFHPGVNGKPMIDDNGMVALRDGHVKLIASAWCASTSHHRGPGTKFSFRVELSGMTRHQVDPALVYEGRSDEVEIYASHGRDKGTRLANKNLDKSSKSHSPPLHDRSTGPPSPAKTTASSPPSSPSASTTHYEGPSKKRREDPPLTPPIIDHDLPPTIKSLEPRKGPICRENHVIIIGSNFAHGMTPMFGREHGTVIEVNPFYIECTTPIYPNVETVPVWIYHNDTFTTSDKTYDFTNELAQSDLELLLRNVLPANGEGLDAASFMSLMGRLPGVPSSTDISGQTASNGSTMLHNAALLGYQKGVDMLIEEGIELDIEDDAGFTALDYAIFINNVEITEALLLAGSMPSYERMSKLPLVPTIEMSALLKDLCDIDLPESSTSRESEQELDGVIASEEISGHDNELARDAEGDVLPDTASETMGLEEDQHMSLAPISEQVRMLRNPRPLSIATVSTQSTGMVSIAPTMSTLASSAASSTLISPQHSRHPRTMIPRAGNQVVKGGLENIWQCAKKGNLDMVKHHLQKEPTLINTPWKFDGRSALISACASSQPQELVEFLVTRGAHLNHTDTFYKRTALHTLCEEGGLSQDDWGLGMLPADREANERDVLAAMRFLLDNGADVDAKNHWKETALMRLFAGRDYPLMVQELYSRGADSRLKSSKDAYPHGTALCYAAFFGRAKSLKWMIENDLLLNDEANIKEAIRWAKLNKSGSSSHSGSRSSTLQSATIVQRKEECKAEVIRLLEGWLGEAGLTKRKALAKDVTDQSGDDWWRRMSGIVDDQSSKQSSTTDMDVSSKMDLEDAMEASHAKEESDSQSGSKMPLSMMPLWREVHTLSEVLSQGSDTVTSPSRMKWLTMLRK